MHKHDDFPHGSRPMTGGAGISRPHDQGAAGGRAANDRAMILVRSASASNPPAHPATACNRPWRGRIARSVLLSAIVAGPMYSVSPDSNPSAESAWVGLDDLMKVRVVTVSRHEQELFATPAAVAVLSREDIEDVGATSLPEALRWVPGLNVAQITANSWAVGARGFQWQFANKLLVMIDGRSVYSPTSGGVRWEDNTAFLDDLERIEVVRGPGSSIWGANAVNGVINVVTRSAFDTIGTHSFAGTGNELQAYAGIREGLKLSDDAAIRVYANYRQAADNVLPDGGSAADGAKFGQGGFRLDWKPTTADAVALSGDYFAQRTEYVRTFTTLQAPPTYAFTSDEPIRSHGANVLGRWRHEWTDKSYLEWRNFWDWHYVERPQNTESVTTADTDLVWGTTAGKSQAVTAGAGYRLTSGDLGARLFNYVPSGIETHLFSAFVQDEITVAPDRLMLTLGTKVEHHTFTGWSPQPTARLSYTPSPDLVVWGSAARAIRAPTWIEVAGALDAAVYPPGVFDPTLPAAIRIYGNPNLSPERLTAYELGARWKLADRLTVDAALFSYAYGDYVLISYTDVTAQTTPPAVVLGTQYQNGIRGESYGGELALRYKPANWWRLQASYSYVQIELHTMMSDPFQFEQDETTTPDHTVRLQSSMRFGREWEFNLAGRYVGTVPYYTIPAYVETDAALLWKPGHHWQASLSGRNLLHNHHLEYDSALNRRLTEISRSVFFLVKWDY
jgi:iron complex outermembrane receptor protein